MNGPRRDPLPGVSAAGLAFAAQAGPERESTTVETVRLLVHRRYVRALVVGAMLVTIAGSLLTIGLQLTMDVTHRGVLRFLFRSHVQEIELSSFVSDPRTLMRLQDLFSADETLFNPGGFVYAYDGSLVFHPHETLQASATRGARSLNRRWFPKLAERYFDGDLDGLLHTLREPEVLRRLGEHDLVGDLERLEAAEAEVSADDVLARRRLLRLAARQIEPFLPGSSRDYELGLGEKLRFYDRNAPRGQYLGLFEIRAPQLRPSGADPVAAEQSRHGYFLSIYRSGNGLMLESYYRGELRLYALVPVELPNGMHGWRVALAA